MHKKKMQSRKARKEWYKFYKVGTKVYYYLENAKPSQTELEEPLKKRKHFGCRLRFIPLYLFELNGRP